MQLLEILAVSLGILYLLLAMREQVWCWLAGCVSTLIFAYLCFCARLYMDAGLQLYYVVMSLVGWWQWRYGGDESQELIISSWPVFQHCMMVVLIVMLSVLSEMLLVRYTQAAYPLLDAIVAWGGVVATVMLTRKVLENWLYWIVLDALGVVLFCSKGLYLTAGLSGVYTILAVRAYFLWRQRLQVAEHSVVTDLL